MRAAAAAAAGETEEAATGVNVPMTVARRSGVVEPDAVCACVYACGTDNREEDVRCVGWTRVGSTVPAPVKTRWIEDITVGSHHTRVNQRTDE